jgi:hypothetical protein
MSDSSNHSSISVISSVDSYCLLSPTQADMSTSTKPKAKLVRVAAIQAEPEWNDLQAGVTKSIKLIAEAGANGANVVGFPEVFIPGYPW